MIQPADYAGKVAKISRIKKVQKTDYFTLLAQKIEEFRTGVPTKSNSDE